MSKKQNIEAIYALLDRKAASKNLENKTQVLLYKLGFLIGMLASLMEDDFYLKQRINHLIDPNKK